MSSLVESLKTLVEPWAAYYKDNEWLRTTLMVLHLGALLIGGGLAVAADRFTLRALRVRRLDLTILEEQHQVHAVIIASLVAFFVSGVGMSLSNVDKYATSWIYWVKMGLFTLLLINGLALLRVERQLGRDATPASRAWGTLRRVCASSAALWMAITLFGVLLIEA